MDNMFYSDSAFNQNIGSWNLSSLLSTSNMFSNTTVFNQDISLWNVSSITNMDYMFYNADAFNQNISGWSINPLISPNPPIDFATGSPIDGTTNVPTWPT
jgi:surface protein